MTQVQACENCRYSWRLSAGLACRRYPPLAVGEFGAGAVTQVRRSVAEGVFPGLADEIVRVALVKPDWWCGEWCALVVAE